MATEARHQNHSGSIHHISTGRARPRAVTSIVGCGFLYLVILATAMPAQADSVTVVPWDDLPDGHAIYDPRDYPIIIVDGWQTPPSGSSAITFADGAITLDSRYFGGVYIDKYGRVVTAEVSLLSNVVRIDENTWDYTWTLTNHGTGTLKEWLGPEPPPNFLNPPPLAPGQSQVERDEGGPPRLALWGGIWNGSAPPGNFVLSLDEFDPAVHGHQAFYLTIIPLPAAGWAGLALLGAMGGVAGMRRKFGIRPD